MPPLPPPPPLFECASPQLCDDKSVNEGTWGREGGEWEGEEEGGKVRKEVGREGGREGESGREEERKRGRQRNYPPFPFVCACQFLLHEEEVIVAVRYKHKRAAINNRVCLSPPPLAVSLFPSPSLYLPTPDYRRGGLSSVSRSLSLSLCVTYARASHPCQHTQRALAHAHAHARAPTRARTQTHALAHAHTYAHARARARQHANTHARTHGRTHARTLQLLGCGAALETSFGRHAVFAGRPGPLFSWGRGEPPAEWRALPGRCVVGLRVVRVMRARESETEKGRQRERGREGEREMHVGT